MLQETFHIQELLVSEFLQFLLCLPYFISISVSCASDAISQSSLSPSSSTVLAYILLDLVSVKYSMLVCNFNFIDQHCYILG